MLEFLDHSTIEQFRNTPGSGVYIVAPSSYWGKSTEQQQRIQIQLRHSYTDWFEHIQLLFHNPPREIKEKLEEIDKYFLSRIDQEGTWDVEPTIELNKKAFLEKAKEYHSLLRLFGVNVSHQVILVPDTNAIIAVPDPAEYMKVAGTGSYGFILTPTVLAELDKLKVTHRDIEFRNKVNSVIKRIKGWRNQGSLLRGVIVNKTVTVKTVATEPNFERTLNWLVEENEDDRIIASALELQRAEPVATVVLVTSDINLQNKAELANLPYAETPKPKKVVTGRVRVRPAGKKR